ncbi:GNAT family N-acetyltransferase [Aeromicrobium endophyticum]|uniref:N-acetyltransferase n=1 Tax=Aeromicrobium endophyticum TaxID=2292704 RepID=A0A371P8U6_9ACTN|nr:GNAT family N-acetyltransferase [Aeromicrobium endophyticum]REK72361.1 N-acetyltransferase [Aeromicrobium endophyticum]
MTVRLQPLDPQAFRALEAGDRVVAEQLIGAPVPDEFQAPVEIWTFMLRLLRDDPAHADWLMNAVVAEGVIVGNAGFKGAPVDGQVELGYRISSAHRRRGLAVVAVTLLLDRARHEPLVDRVIARIAPDNEASVGVVTKAGFVPDGEWMHPRWGRQLQFVHRTPSS